MLGVLELLVVMCDGFFRNFCLRVVFSDVSFMHVGINKIKKSRMHRLTTTYNREV